MTPEESEEAGRLLSAARSDLRATRVLAPDTGQANDVIGFHAQQAVEKAIKAVLVANGVEIAYTHDLGLLLDVLAQHAIVTPDSVRRADWLTPWAVAARYGTSDASLDREARTLGGSPSVGLGGGDRAPRRLAHGVCEPGFG
ncbi:MAG: HEPN domain-containing protein [Solirubrobacteraceae bacterium]